MGVSDRGGARTSDQAPGSSQSGRRVTVLPLVLQDLGGTRKRRAGPRTHMYLPSVLSCLHQEHERPHAVSPLVSSVSFPRQVRISLASGWLPTNTHQPELLGPHPATGQ